MEKLRYTDFWRKDLERAKGVALNALKMYIQTLGEMNVGLENEVYRIMVYNAGGYIDAIEEIDGVLRLKGEEFERKAADLVNRCGYNFMWHWLPREEIPDFLV